MRITYPNQPIYLGDDDIKNAFRLIKINPKLVPMHRFVDPDHLILNTGMTFGNRNGPYNFDKPAMARAQHAEYLWGTANIDKLKTLMPIPKLQTEELGNAIPFGSASKDKYNKGVLDENRNRIPTKYGGHHVDNLTYAEVKEYL